MVGPAPPVGHGLTRVPRACRATIATAALIGLVLIGVVLMAAGWALLDSARRHRDEGVLPGTAPPTSAAYSSASTGYSSPPVSVSVSGPHRLRAEVEAVASTTGGDLALPSDGDRVGWWALGAAAGSSRGTLLLAGHVDTDAGLGAFAALHDLDVDARVEVTAADGRVHGYRVTARRTYPRDELPTDLFSPDGPPRLALLTCAGDYDRGTGGYESNLVLYATPT